MPSWISRCQSFLSTAIFNFARFHSRSLVPVRHNFKLFFGCFVFEVVCRVVRRQNTSPGAAHTHIFLVVRREAQLSQLSRFNQCTRIDSRLAVCRVLKIVRLLPSHSLISCLVATSLACLSVSLLFLIYWEINCNDPCGGACFGRVAELSPITGCGFLTCVSKTVVMLMFNVLKVEKVSILPYKYSF